MSLQSRRELIFSVRIKYKGSCWKKKSKILDGFIAATGYQRKYAIKLLNSAEIKHTSNVGRRKEPKYNKVVQTALIAAWRAVNEICAKRLVPFLPELVTALERYGHLSLASPVRERLLSISAATADRLLKPERQKYGKGMSTTKPGGLLKKQIKIRTFADWDDVVPGFFEGDLVAHCGDNVEGSFLNTFVLTDIASGWTEFLPLLCKSSANVISGMNIILELLPFKLLGVDTDNGSEFINYELLNFCKDQKITFTRSRAYKKNDQAHVEEKNGSIIRRMVGYDRYEGTEAWHALADLYAVLRLYVNFFQPSLKLESKTRNGAKTIKKYDKAQTPCQRLLNSGYISEDVKNKLKKDYKRLDPVDLLERIKKHQEIFWKLAWAKQNAFFGKTKEIESEIDLIKNATSDDEQIINSNNTQVDLPNRKYRRTRKPTKTNRIRTWRTKPDPFEKVWDDLRLQLEISPHRTAKSLLEDLVAKQPEDFSYKQLRTLQRRVAEWRAEQLSKSKKDHLALCSQEDATNQYLSLVMNTGNR